jgi:intracellular sulfur oxidation DsrE/DsrF family protein
MRALFLSLVLSIAGPAALLSGQDNSFSYPLIPGYGGVVALPEAAEPARPGARIVFDITADGEPDRVNRGLESVARYLNLNAQAGHRADDVSLALVLHGSATRCGLSDEAYRGQTQQGTNPNIPLLRELKKHGVELYICGQSLVRNKFPEADVTPELTVAVSAMTVNVNKQLAGFAYLAFP